LFLVHDTVHDLKERWLGGLLARAGVASVVGLSDSDLSGSGVARAALWLLGFTSRLLALKLALWLLAVSWLGALVLAVKLLADWRALWFWGFALDVALSWLADVLALWATFLFAGLLWATDGADRLSTVDSALGAWGFFALHLAVWLLADRVAHSWALWIITLPFAVRVAL
jgi:hypothetical protein